MVKSLALRKIGSHPNQQGSQSPANLNIHQNCSLKVDINKIAPSKRHYQYCSLKKKDVISIFSFKLFFIRVIRSISRSLVICLIIFFLFQSTYILLKALVDNSVHHLFYEQDQLILLLHNCNWNLL